MYGIIGAIVKAVGEVVKGGLQFGAAVKQSQAVKSVADKSVEEAQIVSEAKLKAGKEEVKQQLLRSAAAKSATEAEIDKADRQVMVVIVLLLLTGVLGYVLYRKKQSGGQ